MKWATKGPECLGYMFRNVSVVCCGRC